MLLYALKKKTAESAQQEHSQKRNQDNKYKIYPLVINTTRGMMQPHAREYISYMLKKPVGYRTRTVVNR